MNIEVIGMPMYYGCDVPGADLVYDAVEENLENIFEKNKIAKKFKINSKIKKIEKYNKKKYGNLKYLENIMDLNKNLYEEVKDALKENNLPIIIGGDHSGVIGSIAADLDYYNGDVSVIWIDAHLDIHTDYDSPSGNIHGIPLSVCIGRCKNENLNIGKNKLIPQNLFYLGIRSYEKEEEEYIKKENIFWYKDNEINKDNLDNILEELIKKIKTKKVHISFDFDSFAKEEFSSVNVEYKGTYTKKGGFYLDEAKKILIKLIKNLNISTIDFVEYNPLLDTTKNDLKKLEDIIKVVDEVID